MVIPWSQSLWAIALCFTTAAGTQKFEVHPNQTLTGAALVTADRLPLHTHGRYIVDRFGFRVKWACTNWYGAYSTTHVVGGLEIRPIHEIVKRIVDLGFNCVRMMYSTQGYVHNPAVSQNDLAANQNLWGMRFLELFDLTIKLLTDAGLMVIVNNHNSKSGWCCHYSQDEGLWYVPEYSEEQWIESLVFFTNRYKDNKYVVALDLRNEVHDYKDTHLTWGDGNEKTDWALAATKAGNAVLQANPDVIIVVMAMCFGLDLRPMRDAPISLSVPNKVVYQAHNYLEFQIFDNIAKMVAPWRTIRWYLVLVIIPLLIVEVLLWSAWRSLGKPKPPWPLVGLGVASCIAAFALAGVIVSAKIMEFGSLFCEIGARRDTMPWLVSCLVACLLSSLVALACVVLLFRQRRSYQSMKSMDEETPQSPTTLGKADMDVDAAVPDERMLPRGASPKQNDSDKVSQSAAKAPDTAAEQHGTEDSMARRRSVIAPGFNSWKLVRKYLSSNLKDKPGYVPWDRGLCCGMQCFIVLGILTTVFVGFYICAHFFPTYWFMEQHLEGLWGFALQENRSYTAPVWMGEFGQEVRGHYWLNFVRYLSARDVDFAYWAINGRKWAEGEVDTISGNFINYDTPRWESETFGLLQDDYSTVRNPWMTLDLQALMQSPSRWIPDALPCGYDVHPSCQ